MREIHRSDLFFLQWIVVILVILFIRHDLFGNGHEELSKPHDLLLLKVKNDSCLDSCLLPTTVM